jgi:ribonuclease T2
MDSLLMKGIKDAQIYAGAGLLFLAASPAVLAAPTGYIMDIQMVPALCSLDPAYSKKRKCLEGYSLNISGLYPQTTSTNCTTRSSAKLSPLQARVIARIMPDENTRALLWRNIGGCIPMNATQYFRTVINYADRLKVPEELTEQENHSISIDLLRAKFLKINPKLPTSALRFNCQANRSTSLLTSIQVCYNSQGGYKACPSSVMNTCPRTVTIKGIY